MANYIHKRLLELRDIHLGEAAAHEQAGAPYAQLVDPALKRSKVLCAGNLQLILDMAPTHGYLIRGVRRGAVHILIRSGHADIGPLGCMDSPSDEEAMHALKEDPGVLLQVVDPKSCPICDEMA